MGEVYRARDPRLDREVAIKVLHETAAADASRRARFELEARVVAALNHPNILGVYDFASDEGRYYIVSELVNGESLRARVDRGPIGIREFYRIAVQIADGLSAAHAAGIAHRDLKPENVMLTTDGRIKILDFGLARHTGSNPVPGDSTTTQLNTMAGTVMGTVAYMSPEQARGIAADHRSDQFSFGTMLYELVCGERPFTRETSPQTMTAILTEEPPALDSKVPPPLRWTIARCHENDPGARYESTRDLYHDLRNQQEHLSDVLTSTDAPVVQAAGVFQQRRRWLLTAVVAAALLVGVAGGRWSKPGTELGQLRFTPMEVALARPAGPRWSPDGKSFAYSAVVSGMRQVFLRYLNSAAPVQLTQGTIDVMLAGWTPDGKRVIVRSATNGQTDFSSVPAIGGDAELIATETRPIYALDIAQDGKAYAVFVKDGGRHIIATAPSAGSPGKRYQPGPFEADDIHNTPTLRISPDHRRMLLLVGTVAGNLAWDIPLPSGNKAPRQVLPGVARFAGNPQVSWLPDSRHIVLAMQVKSDDVHRHLWIADIDSGRRRPLTGGLSSEFEPDVSPDGSRILFRKMQTEYSLVSVALNTAAADRIVTSEIELRMPAWARHQEEFTYQSNRNGPPEIWLHANGWDRPVVGPAQFPAGSTSLFLTPALSPGGDRVVYSRAASDGSTYNWISSVSGGSPMRLTNESNVSEFGGSWSPDGKSFAYLRLANGKTDLAVVRTSGEAIPVIIRRNIGSRVPDWSPDGRWIAVYDQGAKIVSPDGKIVRDLGYPDAIQFTFSKDSRVLYGIREHDGRPQLFSVDIETRNQKVIGEFDKDLLPYSNLNPSIRLSLSPDGKSILFSAQKTSASIWMLEGFDPPTWMERLREMLPW